MAPPRWERQGVWAMPRAKRNEMSQIERASPSLPAHPVRRRTPAPRAAQHEATSGWLSPLRTPKLVLLWTLSLILPTAASFYVGDLRVTLYRIILLAVFVPCLGMLLTGRAGRLRLSDVLMALWVSWTALTFAVNHGFGAGVRSGGIYVVEGLGAYLLARCFIRDAQAFRAFASLLCVVILGLLAFVTFEALTGYNVFRDLFGGRAYTTRARFDLYRAEGPFPHSILLGVFCAAGFGLAFYALARDDRWRPMRLVRSGLIGVATFMSVSAGPVMGLMVAGGIAVWDRLTRTVLHRWWILAGGGVALWFLVGLLSERPLMRVLAHYTAFSAHTGYYRISIWEYGLGNVRENPLFGIGFHDWDRATWMAAESVDNFWLLVAMRHGVPAVMALLAAVVLIAWNLARLKNLGPGIQRLRMAWMSTIIGLSVAAFTVHLWEQVFVLFTFLIGAGVWMLDPRPGTSPEARRRSD